MSNENTKEEKKMGEGKEKRKVEERLPERSGENNRGLMTRRLCPVTVGKTS